jgi:preprotein translocase subunit SecB
MFDTFIMPVVNVAKMMEENNRIEIVGLDKK